MQELVDPEESGEEDKKKKSPLVMTIVAGVVATVVAAGGGWVVGGMLAPQAIEMQEAAELAAGKAEAGGEEEEIPIAGEEGPNLIRMQPITTNLSFPADSWVRMEVSLVVKGEPDIEMVELIHQDMVSYLRTLSIQQVEGARGFRYVRDDLVERAVLRSKGNVENILIRTFVIE